MSLQIFNLVIALSTFVIILICAFTILYTYIKLRLKPIFLYFFGILCLGFGCIGILLSILPLQEIIIKPLQSYMFIGSWLGIFFLYLAIKSSKGPTFGIDTSIVSGVTGAIIISYISQAFYDISWNPVDQVWTMEFHPLLMVLLLINMLFIVFELVTFMRHLYLRTRHPKVRRNLLIYFLGWLMFGVTGPVFMMAMLIPWIPFLSYLIPLASGLVLVTIAIVLLPSSLIATTKKIFNVGFIQLDTGLVYLFYDFRAADILNEPLLISGIVSAIDTCLSESVRGCKYLKVIDTGPRKIIIERGFNTQAIMIVETDAPILKSILKRLLLLFEFEHFDSLSNRYVDPALYVNFRKIIEEYMAFAL